MVKFLVLKEFKLVVRKFFGTIDLSDIVHSNDTIAKTNDFDASFGILNDVRDCKLEYDVRMVKNLVEKIKSSKEFYKKRNGAILTNQPEHVVLAELLNLYQKDNVINLKVFSTFYNALNHLNISADAFSIISQRIISELDSEFRI